MLYELQYHKDTLIDVRHVGDDGIPRGRFGEPKPWGSGETKGDFRIERLQLSTEEGEKYRMASKAHEGAREDDGQMSDEALVAMVNERKDDADFRSRLATIGIRL